MTNLTIRINLNLSQYCIETAIRRRYNRCLSQVFKARFPDKDWDKDLEYEIDLLKTALESFDFEYLRSTWPELAGHGKAEVTLGWDHCHLIRIRINGHLIE